MDNSFLGKLGESYVCKFLVENEYRIIHRNFRFGRFSEIDIIAIKSRRVNFIEVKTRTDFELNEQYKSVSKFKVIKIKRGIAKFLSQNRQFYSYELRLKVAVVLINPYTKKPKVVFYDYIN
jgi:putative endonuclease